MNAEGDHTNKIEGHWRQAKAKFPAFGVRKNVFSSYQAEFMWRYEHKGEVFKNMNTKEKFLKTSFLRATVCVKRIGNIKFRNNCLCVKNYVMFDGENIVC